MSEFKTDFKSLYNAYDKQLQKQHKDKNYSKT